MPRLLLLARRFPFNHGEVAAESYLEAEIGFLAPYFDEVLAVGTEAAEGEVPTCELPGNVIPLALGCTAGKADKAMLAAHGAAYALAAPRLVKEALATDPVENVAQSLFRGYFAARAYCKFEKLRERLAKVGFVPTHVYSFWLYDTALVALWVKRTYLCAGAVARAHGYDLYRDRTRVNYLPFRHLLLSGLDVVLPCSEDGKVHIERNWPGHSDRLEVAYLGTRELPDRSEEPKGEPFRIVSCSRVVDVKRVPLIAEAMRLLDAEGARLVWTHYGDGPELKGVREACDSFSSVRAELPGSISNAELLERYGSEHIDLFVNVSESEGLPISIMEACGIGVPVLATDVGGVREIVRDGENGTLLAPSPTPGQVADAIKESMNVSAERAAEMRRASRAVWFEKFRTRSNVEQLARALGVEGEDA